MQMDENSLKRFRADFANSVKALEQSYGVKISLGNISYNEARFTSKVTVMNLDEIGKPKIDPNAERKARFHLSLQIQNANICQGPIFGTQWKTIMGEIITIVDWKSRNNKYPVVYTKGNNGQQYKSSVRYITGRA